MADHLECPHCRSELTATLKAAIGEDREFIRQGFTNYCTRCFDKHGNTAAAHFFVDGDGAVFALPPRPQGLRVEIDEAEMAVTDNVHKIPDIAGRMGAAAAKLEAASVAQAFADIAAASGIAADQMKIFGQACHSAGIGKPLEVAVDSSGMREVTVATGETIERGQVVYLDDDGKARVMKAPGPALLDIGLSIGGRRVLSATDVTLTIESPDELEMTFGGMKQKHFMPSGNESVTIKAVFTEAVHCEVLPLIIQACRERTPLKDVRLAQHAEGAVVISEALVTELRREAVNSDRQGELCEFRWSAVIIPAPGVQLVYCADDAADDLEPGTIEFLPEGMTMQPFPDAVPEMEFEYGNADDECEPLLIDDSHSTPPKNIPVGELQAALESATLKADGIPTERGWSGDDDAKASRTARAAVWLFKAGAGAGVGAGILWAVKQLLKAAL